MRSLVCFLLVLLLLAITGCGKKKEEKPVSSAYANLFKKRSGGGAKKATAHSKKRTAPSRRKKVVKRKGKTPASSGTTSLQDKGTQGFSLLMRLKSVSDKKLERLNVNPVYFELLFKQGYVTPPNLSGVRNVFRDVKKNLKLREEAEKIIEEVSTLLEDINKLGEDKYQKTTYKKAKKKFEEAKKAYENLNYLKAIALLKESKQLAEQSVALEYRAELGITTTSTSVGGATQGSSSSGFTTAGLIASKNFIYYGYYYAKGGMRAFIGIKDAAGKLKSTDVVGKGDSINIEVKNGVYVSYKVVDLTPDEIVLKSKSGILKIKIARLKPIKVQEERVEIKRQDVTIISTATEETKKENEKK